jgi:hypothetical protein
MKFHAHIKFSNFQGQAFFYLHGVGDGFFLESRFSRKQRRVARWHIFKPKIPTWVNFGRSCNGRCWYILWPFGLFYCHLVYIVSIWYMYLMVIWYIFPRFGMLYQDKSGNPEATSDKGVEKSNIFKTYLTLYI